MANSLTRDRILNVTAVIATLCATTAVGIRVRDIQSATQTLKRIGNGPQYASAGQRIGSPAATVTIVEFADFQCPICRRAAPYLDSVLVRNPNDVALVYRHFPVHQHANAAARAAECAAHQSAFHNVERLLFQQSESIGVKSWVSFATEAGVKDTGSFKACMSDPTTQQAIARDSAAGRALRISGTPTFIINDLEVDGFLGDTVMNRLIAEAKASRTKNLRHIDLVR